MVWKCLEVPRAPIGLPVEVLFGTNGLVGDPNWFWIPKRGTIGITRNYEEHLGILSSRGWSSPSFNTNTKGFPIENMGTGWNALLTVKKKGTPPLQYGTKNGSVNR